MPLDNVLAGLFLKLPGLDLSARLCRPMAIPTGIFESLDVDSF